MNQYLSAYVQHLTKLALKDHGVTLQTPLYESIADSVVRMPGPTPRPRKFHGPHTNTPTEASKPHPALHAAQEVAADRKTDTIEGIN